MSTKEKKEQSDSKSLIQKINALLPESKTARNAVIIGGAVLVVAIIILLCVLFAGGRSLSITAESSLKEIFTTSEISTVEYTYNSTVTVSEEEKEKYHLSYKGVVKAGFDFSKIEIKDDKKNSKLIVTLPAIKITETSVDSNSIDAIFVKSKYETETIFQEAYRLCKEDLEKKAKKNTAIFKMAQDNALSTVQGLMKPWEEELPKEYTIEYKWEEAK